MLRAHGQLVALRRQRRLRAHRRRQLSQRLVQPRSVGLRLSSRLLLRHVGAAHLERGVGGWEDAGHREGPSQRCPSLRGSAVAALAGKDVPFAQEAGKCGRRGGACPVAAQRNV